MVLKFFFNIKFYFSSTIERKQLALPSDKTPVQKEIWRSNRRSHYSEFLTKIILTSIIFYLRRRGTFYKNYFLWKKAWHFLQKQVFMCFQSRCSFCPVGHDMPKIVLKSKYLLFVLFRCVNLKFVVNINGVTRVSLFASE